MFFLSGFKTCEMYELRMSDVKVDEHRGLIYCITRIGGLDGNYITKKGVIMFISGITTITSVYPMSQLIERVSLYEDM